MSRGRPAVARSVALVAAAVVVGGSALVACGPENDTPSRPGALPSSTDDDPTSAPSGQVPDDLDPDAGVSVESGTAAPSDADEAAVWEVYLAFWDADAQALADPELPLDGLRDLLVDPQLSRTTDFIEGQRDAGLRSAGLIHVRPRVTSVTAERAVVHDCLDDTGLWSVDSSGEVVAGSGGAAQSVAVTLLPVDDGWVVSDLGQGPAGGCAVSDATP